MFEVGTFKTNVFTIKTKAYRKDLSLELAFKNNISMKTGLKLNRLVVL